MSGKFAEVDWEEVERQAVADAHSKVEDMARSASDADTRASLELAKTAAADIDATLAEHDRVIQAAGVTDRTRDELGNLVEETKSSIANKTKDVAEHDAAMNHPTWGKEQQS